MNTISYSYSLNDNGTMTIWEDNCTLCEVSDVWSDEQANELLRELVYEMRNIELD